MWKHQQRLCFLSGIFANSLQCTHDMPLTLSHPAKLLCAFAPQIRILAKKRWFTKCKTLELAGLNKVYHMVNTWRVFSNMYYQVVTQGISFKTPAFGYWSKNIKPVLSTGVELKRTGKMLPSDLPAFLEQHRQLGLRVHSALNPFVQTDNRGGH